MGSSDVMTMGPGKRLLMRANDLVRHTLFNRRVFVRSVFGAEMAADTSEQSYCEWNSILFRVILRRYLRPGIRVLDMGTGAHALLAIVVKKLCPGATVVASDILAQRIELARRTAALNRIELDCRAADLFTGLAGKFDLVLFAPPVIPSEHLRELGFHPRRVANLGSRRCWSSDGGRDGLQILLPFLQQLPHHLADHGIALVTLNPSHLPLYRFEKLCQTAGLSVRRVHRWPGIVAACAVGLAQFAAGPGEEMQS